MTLLDYVNYDQTGHVFEFHYRDDTTIFIAENTALRDFALAENILYILRDLINYKVNPSLVESVVGHYYYNKTYDEEPKCVF